MTLPPTGTSRLREEEHRAAVPGEQDAGEILALADQPERAMGGGAPFSAELHQHVLLVTAVANCYGRIYMFEYVSMEVGT